MGPFAALQIGSQIIFLIVDVVANICGHARAAGRAAWRSLDAHFVPDYFSVVSACRKHLSHARPYGDSGDSVTSLLQGTCGAELFLCL